MKLLAFFVLGLTVFQAASKPLLEEDVENKCLLEQKLDEDKMKATLQVSTTPDDDEEYGIFYVCVWKGRNAMKEDGSIDADAFKEFLQQLLASQPFQPDEIRDKIVNNIVNQCKEEKGDKEGQTAIKLKNCMVRVVNQMVKNKTVDI